MRGSRALVGICVFSLTSLVACREGDVIQSIPTPPPTVEVQEPPTEAPFNPPTVSTAGNPPVVEEPEVFDTTPTETPDGVPAPLAGVYTDKGAAPPDHAIRGLISFPIRNKAALESAIFDIYDPTSPRFRKYLTVEDWNRDHAPLESDIKVVADWLTKNGMKVERIATNRLLLNYTGTVRQFNDTFGVELRIFERKAPQAGNDPHDVYGLLENINAPKSVADRIHGLPALDLPTHPGPLKAEASGTIDPPPASLKAFSPDEIAAAYGFDKLYAQGYRGKGVKLGVAIGASFRFNDLRGFWQHMGITRADPVVYETMEPPGTRYREGTLDVQWAGAMAPEADLVVYMGPDARNTSMIYTFNEAIGQNQIHILTDSYCHREDSEPKAMYEAYSHAAMQAAAYGITVMAAGGDSSGIDVPGNSPWVTSVGGTNLVMSGHTVVNETTWQDSGSGISRTIPRPWWQEGLPDTGGKRAVADLALNSGEPYYFLWLGEWRGNWGTSFASPVFAGMIATVNDARAAQGKPRVGWINSHLYTLPAVRNTFRDITHGQNAWYASDVGWDIPTGWGAPDAKGLVDTLP